jgi:hypothetical protein
MDFFPRAKEQHIIILKRKKKRLKVGRVTNLLEQHIIILKRKKKSTVPKTMGLFGSWLNVPQFT